MSDVKDVLPEADQTLPAELRDLAISLESTPIAPQAKGSLSLSFGRVVEMVNRRRRVLKLVQEALSQLRLDVKYLMFDLEVTRRERDELRERLEEIENGFQ